ncbi:hypothetical protein EKD04_025585 [Chloroflexales bacterium ZM16-3]|nr:hypothetical protein [Chloroflexales bacterium ZM16-3]
MNPLTWARVVFSPQADAIRQRMDQEHIHRLRRVIQVIKNAPEDGKFFAEESDGTVLRQMTGADTHVIYSVVFWPVGRVLRIARIEIRDWQPLDH